MQLKLSQVTEAYVDLHLSTHDPPSLSLSLSLSHIFDSSQASSSCKGAVFIFVPPPVIESDEARETIHWPAYCRAPMLRMGWQSLTNQTVRQARVSDLVSASSLLGTQKGIIIMSQSTRASAGCLYSTVTFSFGRVAEA